MHAATGITGLRRLEGGPAGYLPAGRAGGNGRGIRASLVMPTWPARRSGGRPRGSTRAAPCAACRPAGRRRPGRWPTPRSGCCPANPATSTRTRWSSTAARPASDNGPGGTRPFCLRALPFHWQFGQTADHRTGTHPKLLERDCEPHRREARQQLGEDRLQFDPGQRGAETVVAPYLIAAAPGPARDGGRVQRRRRPAADQRRVPFGQIPALPSGRYARAGLPAIQPGVGGASAKGQAPVPSRGTGRRPRPGGVAAALPVAPGWLLRA